jgi:hypothetical protein
MEQRYAVGGMLLVLVALTAKDMFFGADEEETASQQQEGGIRRKEIPQTNLRNIMTGPTLKFNYCYS